VAQKEGNLEEAWKLLQAAQEAAQKSNSKEAAGRVLSRWASFYLDQKDAATAAVFLQQAQGLAVTPALKGAVAHQWGRYYLAQGNTEEALAQFNRALKADREVLHRAAMAGDLFSLGETYKQRGEFSQAWEYYSRAFEVYAGLSQKTQMQRCLEHLKEVNSQGGLGHSLERFEKHPKLKPS
jgi:tetratricopeptide (TPR) repeat protein